MSFLNDQSVKLTQTITYWAEQKDSGYGSKAWVTPVTLKCRYEQNTSRGSGLGAGGGGSALVINFNARVWTLVPLRVGGYICLGEWLSQPKPTDQPGASEILSSEQPVTLDGEQVLYVATL